MSISLKKLGLIMIVTVALSLTVLMQILSPSPSEREVCSMSNYAWDGDEKAIRKMLNEGVDPNRMAICSTGPPLSAAAQQGHDKVVDMLIPRSTFVNICRAYEEASLWGHVHTLKVIAARINAKTVYTGSFRLIDSAFLQAVDLSTCSYLLKEGANINIPDPESGDTLLMKSAGADYDAETQKRLGPKRFQMMKFLVKSGANTHLRNRDGYTALRMAEETGNKEVANYLRSIGALR